MTTRAAARAPARTKTERHDDAVRQRRRSEVRKSLLEFAMLDINLLRNDLPGVAAALAKRGVTLDAARFEALEAERKDIQTRTQELQARRNALSQADRHRRRARARTPRRCWPRWPASATS